jgi:preprotein translocase subunit SecG
MTINFLNIAQVLVAIALIGFILIQRGPGATAGSAFGGGGGASGTVFGAKGSGSFLTKATAILATLFFIITMLIAVDASSAYSSTGEAVEKDLGVFGTLDATNLEPTMQADEAIDVDAQINSTLDAVEQESDALVDEANQAVDEAIENASDVIDEVVEDATDVIDEVNEDEASVDDADGGTN